ncbi:MAG: radical SAM protein [Bacteriovoracaceae bacterium]|nr:radical SAM protein [Bacteriovoracaceae bacterium]
MLKNVRWHIVPSLFCNYSCDHCCNHSGPQMKKSLSQKELQSLKRGMMTHNPSELQFVGGEPSLFIDEINEIISYHNHYDKINISLATNGWFATTTTRAIKYLKKFKRLTHIQMSFDIFHNSRSKKEYVINMDQACKTLNLNFNLSITITDVKELVLAKELIQEFGVSAAIGKVESSGRALINGIAFKYPAYDNSVVDKRCTNLEGITFIANKGFTICSSNLIFNHDIPEMFSESIEDLYSNKYFQLLKKCTMGEISKKLKVEMLNDPKYSSVCANCEYLFTTYWKNNNEKNKAK